MRGTTTDIDTYAHAWRKRTQDQGRLRAELARQARREAAALARILVTRYGARHVYLFGSLAGPGPFRETSDIDLAAQGIPPHLFVKASAELARASSFPVDLVPLEACSPALRRAIAAEGLELTAAEPDPAEEGSTP